MTEGFFAKLWVFIYTIILPLIVGYTLKKIFKIPKEKFDILIKINLAFFTPVAIALAFWKMEISRDVLFLPIIGLLVPIAGGVFGYFLSKGRYETDNERGSFVISSMLSNRLNIGGLSSYIIFGEIAYVYVNLNLLLQAVTNYVIGHTVGAFFGNREKMKGSAALKTIFLRITNISVLGMIVGLILKFSGIERPEVVSSFVDVLIKVVAWIALTAVGASIEFRNAMKYFGDTPRMFIVKFILLPIVSAGFAFWLLKDPVAIATVIILGVTPVAINAVIVSKMNNLNEAVTISGFLTTSAFYLIVVFPIMLFIAQKFLV